MEYTIIRSNRRTISIQVKPDQTVVVRAPRLTSQKRIQEFVDSKEDWIKKHMDKAASREDNPIHRDLSETEIKELKKQAAEVIPQRVEYYAHLLGVTYGRITIRDQKTRWGSCSSKGNLNFNCRLMLMPLEVLDSVVVHELCHRKEMNHSRTFYQWVYSIYPEYDKWNRMLK